MRKNIKRIFWAGLFTLILLLGGCAGELRKPVKVCPGAGTIDKAAAILRVKTQNITSLKASGQLKYSNGEGSDSFPFSLWLNPPNEIYLQGNKALDPKAIIAGANKNAFWFAVKPGESVLMIGEWSVGTCFGNALISPRILLEALGVIDIQNSKGWALSQEGAFDVLTMVDLQGKMIKKIYVYNCDYTVYEIKYFGDGRENVSIKLGSYKQIKEGVLVPTLIKIVKYPAAKQKELINLDIKIEVVKPIELSEKQQELIFKQPDSGLYKRVLKFDKDCKLVEQSR